MLEVLYEVLINGTAYVLSSVFLLHLYRRKEKLVFAWWTATVPAAFIALLILYSEYSLHLTRQVNGVLAGLALLGFVLTLPSLKNRQVRKGAHEELITLSLISVFFLLGVQGWTHIFRAAMFLIKLGRQSVGGIDQQLLARWLGLSVGLLLLLLTADLIYRYFGRLDKKADRVVFLALFIIFIKNLIEFFYGLLILKLYDPGDFAYEIIIMQMNYPQGVLLLLLGGGLIIAFFALIRIKLPVPRESDNPAQRRMAKSFAVKKRNANRRVMASLVLVLALGSVGHIYVNTEHEIRPSTEIMLDAEGAFTVNKEDLEDGHIHRFNWKTPNGVNLVFWFIKKRENNYGVVFDGCEICGPAGYLEKGEDVICIECNVMMNRNTIGLKGGCNPIPIKNVIDTPESLTVRAEDLLFQEPFFQGRGVQE
ncbi:hypothetical protein CSB45_15660 [candidate division KSB3 bacterium]|uniref:Membrane iron-sulfur containing protein FtrD-like domain-containing protein n=1 Tax=candidate division KSB3 bacterium TaxID=2044937 RepID=A0A2G6E0S9_9BACT|nr:MAG: hypothetical protein CSB45_15660 [candidate division KSB3 bacterium]